MVWFQKKDKPPKSFEFDMMQESNRRDVLTHRIMNLAVPIHTVHPIVVPLSFLFSNSRAIQGKVSKLPFPSFPYVCRSKRDQSEQPFVRDPMGYDEHVYFFHPRKVHADRPRYNITHSSKEHVFDSSRSKSYEASSNRELEFHKHLQKQTYSPFEQQDFIRLHPRLNDQQHETDHPFGFTYNDNIGGGTEISKQRSKKQKRLVSSSDKAVIFERGWEHVGQIGESFNIPVPPSARQEKEKKKRKTKKVQKMKTSEMSSKSSEQSQEIRHDILPESFSALSTKDQRQVKAQSFSSQENHLITSLSSERIKSISMETMELFSETYDVKNAACSKDALDLFLSLVKAQQFITWTIVFYDDICSSPFLPSTKKYCTPKGPRCRMWNCICDNQVRAMQASAPILGAMFVFPTQKDKQLDLFFLPLCPINDPDDGPKDIDPGYERMASWPSLTISCDTSLHERWETLRTILLCKSLTKVTFNAQIGLMPFHYHCVYDSIDDDNCGMNKVGCLHLDLPNIWDLRLASWMLAPHSDEKSFEIENKKEGFAHLYPEQIVPKPQNAGDHVNGLIDVKEHLEFLYALYPVVDRLLSANGLKNAFYEIESPLQSVLSSMECLGIGFVSERLKFVADDIQGQIDKITKEAHEITGDDSFNLSSPHQVSNYLYTVMGLTPVESPSFSADASSRNSDHLSTSEESLKALLSKIENNNRKDSRIINLILRFRSLNKMLTTFVLPYPKLARNCVYVATRKSNKRSKKMSDSIIQQKIYPVWMQTAVRTGRLSCRKPNLQQVPTGYVDGFSPRSAFVSSSKDMCLFACDYSQNEVRILAHMSNDTSLIELFKNPGTTDIYIQMASIITCKQSIDVTDEERATAKQLTLAIMYGMGPNTVANKLGISLFAAKQFFESFYGRFKGVKRWKEETLTFARKHKYVETITGRKRYLENIDSLERSLSAQAERQAINTVIQGSAADLMKLAMLKMASRISDWRKEGNGDARIAPRLILQIHDELLFELVANKAEVEKFKETVIRCCTEECEEELKLRVPLKLKCSVGTSWGSMQDIG